MEFVTLNHSDLKVSRLCFGCDPMGGHHWGNVSRKEVIAAVHEAVDREINFFDTADIYGLGESEKILGEALKGRRKKAVIATKFGVRRTSDNRETYYDNSSEWIRKAVFRSLKQLNTDYIDLYQMHYRDGITPVDEIVGALVQLKKEGWIRYFGLSNLYKADIADFIESKGFFSTLQDEYSLANRTHEKDMKLIEQRIEVNLLTWGSLGQGVLTGKYDKNTIFDSNDRRSRTVYKNFHGEQLERNLRIVEVMRTLARQYEKGIPAIAIRFILDYLPNSVVITGVKRTEQLLSNLSSLDWHLKLEDIDKLNQISKI